MLFLENFAKLNLENIFEISWQKIFALKKIIDTSFMYTVRHQKSKQKIRFFSFFLIIKRLKLNLSDFHDLNTKNRKKVRKKLKSV